ncbi:glycosyltransferase family 4 protein [Acetanaerobacterium elongatum]|uniref:Glycosyltransferase EpsD n=1 Tax=Acetanaerobacterium elongatum TaxID=258515 RepID=A0A1G9Z3E0_9FIRM|nr:glycosyltransferase family 4 protein [Acetanaerobacterium elongatum]SDN15830.1 glycosyltransferase EpsD [Acetanaerobacterium elongatum]
MKRALFVATVTGHILAFHTPYIKMLTEMGYSVDVAAYGDEHVPYAVKQFFLPFQRNPFSWHNLKAYRSLKKLIDANQYELIHCHTPVAGILTRFAARKARRNGTRVLYTAHGFHFYKGAPLINWLLYYPAELLCSNWTDTLITINHEDFERASRHFHAAQIEYVPGVGIDVDKYANCAVDRAQKRREIGVPEDALLLISAGELNQNKNHEVIIKAIAQLHDPLVYLVLCGIGELREPLEALARSLGVADRVLFLGYRADMPELYKVSDVFVFPSFREGLSASLMEAMACGLAVICSDIRGNRDLITDNINGLLCRQNIPEAYASCIEFLKDPAARLRLSGGLGGTLEPFSAGSVRRLMRKIYMNCPQSL